MMRQYILDADHNPVSMDDIREWGTWFEKDANRCVDATEIGDVRVSTVFLGLAHHWWDKGPPILFETMVFGGPLDRERWQCSTWNEAVAQHEEAVAQVRRALA